MSTSSFDVRIRDGPGRIGNLRIEDQEPLQTPVAVDTEQLLPSLMDRGYTNVPLSAPQREVDSYLVPGSDPVVVHPKQCSTAKSGEILLFANWKTTLADSRRTTVYLEALLTGCPPDAARYAPASALPSNVAMLIGTGFDLFDYTAVDLATVQGKFCMPEGEFPKDYLTKGVCGCQGCLA